MGQGSPKLSAPASKRLVSRIAADLIESRSYLESVQRRIAAGTLPPAVEVMLWHYAYGKPADTVNVNMGNAAEQPLTNATVRERAERVMERLKEAGFLPEHLARPAGIVGAPGTDTKFAHDQGLVPVPERPPTAFERLLHLVEKNPVPPPAPTATTPDADLDPREAAHLVETVREESRRDGDDEEL